MKLAFFFFPFGSIMQNPFLPKRGFKTQAGWLHFVPEGGLLFSPPMNSSSQPLGKAYLEDIFSGLVSTELGPSPGPKGTGEGKTTWTGLCSVADLL